MKTLLRWLVVVVVCAAGGVWGDEGKGDPWVFRCVLDERARVIVAHLQPGVWAAYDAQSCGVYKAWVGEIKLTGAVYHTKHGPQPMSVGDVVFQQESMHLFAVTAHGQAVEVQPRYAGYRFSKSAGHADGPADRVTFLYDLPLPAGGPIHIEETPSANAPTPDGSSGELHREIAIQGLPDQTTLSLLLAGATAPERAKWTTTAGEIKDDHLLISANGTVKLSLPLIAPSKEATAKDDMPKDAPVKNAGVKDSGMKDAAGKDVPARKD